MSQQFSFSEFLKRFPDEESCLEEIKKLRFRNGIFCTTCNETTPHYKLKNRTAYSCEFCRKQVYPLAGTIFEKSTTSLRSWFYALFLMTHTRGSIGIRQLQQELGVTYKTAWRIHTLYRKLMAQNADDMLAKSSDMDEEYDMQKEKSWVSRWVFFSKLEIKVVEKEKSSGRSD